MSMQPQQPVFEIGQTLPALNVGPINRTTLALFAGASGDHNPIHIDLDFARKVGMDDVFAHGMLSMAYLGRLLTNWVPQSQIRSFNARFAGITHLGDVLQCSGKIVKIFEHHGERVAQLELQAQNQSGEAKVLGEALIALP